MRTRLRRCLLVPFVVLLAATGRAEEPTMPRPASSLSPQQVEAFAALALAGIPREYPNKTGHVYLDDRSPRPPREAHPVFFGCFDWHSAVHGHWMLVRLLRLHPDAAIAPRIVELLDHQLTPDKLEVEAAWFRRPENKSWERTYGWAWLLRLAQELRTWEDPRAARWAKALQPLEGEIVRLAKGFLPASRWPLRSGLHIDSAFALSFFLDYARAVGDAELERLAVERARAWYLADRDYPLRYEPSGFDFFSSGLNEADLMRRVLDAKAFSTWLDGFFPSLASGALGPLLEPVEVPDVTDGHLVHLAGLDLTRAWTMNGIAAALPDGDPRAATLRASAKRHAEHGLAYVSSGHYEGEHWLATFAVYLLTDAGARGGV
ncbi:MAG: DUF2891 domain-containing protein [Planctomycetota bacterium]